MKAAFYKVAFNFLNTYNDYPKIVEFDFVLTSLVFPKPLIFLA